MAKAIPTIPSSPQPSRSATPLTRDALAAELFVQKIHPAMSGFAMSEQARKAIEAADAFMAELAKHPG